MFHCFIVMNIFNMVNCRLVDPIPQDVPEPNTENITPKEIEEIKEANKPAFNIFSRPFANFWFWLVLVGECNIQFLIVGYPKLGPFFNTTPMWMSMHFTAVGLGFGSWIITAIIKLTGPKLINAMPLFGEDEAALQKANDFSDSAQKAASFQKSDNQVGDADSDGVADDECEEGLPAADNTDYQYGDDDFERR